jgi:hypothetical protein
MAVGRQVGRTGRGSLLRDVLLAAMSDRRQCARPAARVLVCCAATLFSVGGMTIPVAVIENAFRDDCRNFAVLFHTVLPQRPRIMFYVPFLVDQSHSSRVRIQRPGDHVPQLPDESSSFAYGVSRKVNTERFGHVSDLDDIRAFFVFEVVAACRGGIVVHSRD